MVQRKHEMLLLYKQYCGEDLNEKDTALLTLVAPATIRRWKKIIIWYGMPPYEYFALRDKRNKANRDRRSTNIMGKNHTDILEDIVNNKPELYLDEIQDELNCRTQLHFQEQRISQTLIDLGYTSHKIGNLRRYKNSIEKLEFWNYVTSLKCTPEMFMFIDESAKDKDSIRRRMGRAKKGEQLRYRTDYEQWKLARYTFLAAMDIDGFVSSACILFLEKVLNMMILLQEPLMRKCQ